MVVITLLTGRDKKNNIYKLFKCVHVLSRSTYLNLILFAYLYYNELIFENVENVYKLLKKQNFFKVMNCILIIFSNKNVTC